MWKMGVQWALAENDASFRGRASDELLPGGQAGPGQGQRQPPAAPASARAASMRRRQRSPRPQSER